MNGCHEFILNTKVFVTGGSEWIIGTTTIMMMLVWWIIRR